MAHEIPADLTARASYKFWCESKTRFGDMDLTTHVDQSAYVTLFQDARLQFWKWADHDIMGPVNGFVMVRFAVDIIRAIEHPTTTRIGTRITKMGNSSVAYGQAMYGSTGELCAICEAVNVQVDLKTGKAVPWNADLKKRLLAL
jgi:acyl-CoA thioester hydrolase